MSAHIRLATPADAESVLVIYSPIVLNTVISFEYQPPSVAEMQNRIRTTLTQFAWLVCEIDGTVAGYVYAGSHRTRTAYQWSVDVTAYTHHDYHRRGVGSALYKALFSLLVQQGYFNAYAGVTLPNAASVRLHESLGFTPVGVYKDVGYKFGAWHSVGWWEHRLQPLRPDPPMPLPISAISETEAAQNTLKQESECIR